MGYQQHQLRRCRLASRRHLTETALLAHIRAIHAELRGAYGWPRMWRELRRRGVRVGKERVRWLMQWHGIFQRKYWFPIFLAVATGIFNQVSSINAILYYLNLIFASARFNQMSSSRRGDHRADEPHCDLVCNGGD